MNAKPQVAALPLRDGKVCLVTSRGRRRWVLPKGSVDPGHTPAQAALNEAWEEAGLIGILHPEPVGSYHYEKAGGEYHVTVFVLRVTEEKTTWPERDERTRVWVTPTEAAERVSEPGLQALLRNLPPDAIPRDGTDDPLTAALSGSPAE